jgi:glutaryl-CoA dehydrogenase
MKKYQAIDFYQSDLLLNEEEKMIRDTVRDFVSKEVMPIIGEHYRHGTFPNNLIPKIAELGFLGGPLTGYGCPGMGAVAYGLIIQELERGDSGIRSFSSVQSSLCMYPIWQFGSEDQKQKYLPKMAQGKLIGCFGLTEPDFGSNPGGMMTKAVKKGNKWILNGTKRWITNATIADLAIVWAKNEQGEIVGFIVDKGSKGLIQQEIKGKLSLRASDTGELIMENCEVPDENRMPKAEGLKAPLMCLNQARYGIAWGAIGAAQACFDEALEYSKTRIQFGKPIGGFQLVQNKLAHMVTEITKAQLLAIQLGRLKEQGKLHHTQVSLAKRNNVHMALECARTTRDILGASGITDEYQAMRHMCNLESVYTYEGTHDIHALILGEHLTGISAFE